MAMTQKEYDETLKAKFLNKIDFVKSYLFKDWTGNGAWYFYIIKNKSVLKWYLRPARIPANDFGFPSEIMLGEMILKLLEDAQSDLKLLNPIPKNFSESPEMKNIKIFIKNKDFLEHLDNNTNTAFDQLLKSHLMFISEDKTAYENVLKTLKDLENFVSKIFLFQTTIEDREEKPDNVSIIKLENVSLNILTNLNLNQVLEFKRSLETALEKLKNSPFKKAIYNSQVMIGTADQSSKPRGNSIALYTSHSDHIFYFVKSDGRQYSDKKHYITIIHEYGHRYHHLFMKNGYDNAKIKKLYLEALEGTKTCYLKKIPKIGDPLSNLREDWWTVKMASENYTLTSITNDVYTYTFGEKSKTFTKAEILKLMNCPSQYSAKNEKEFFAEMVTLITLGLVKPSQQVIVDKFLKIVVQDSL